MRSFFRALFALLCILAIPFASAAQEITESTRLPEDAKLVRTLSRCVDNEIIAIDKVCLQTSFFPLLGLSTKDKILEGTFGRNSDGRFFNLALRKISAKGLVGYYEVTFYFEKKVLTGAGADHQPIIAHFIARDGALFGAIPEIPQYAMVADLVSIYDLSSGDYVVGNEHKQAVASLSMSNEKRDAAGLRPLLNEHKTIGQILDERLLNVGTSQAAGTYTKQALERKKAFEKMDNPHRLIVHFD